MNERPNPFEEAVRNAARAADGEAAPPPMPPEASKNRSAVPVPIEAFGRRAAMPYEQSSAPANVDPQIAQGILGLIAQAIGHPVQSTPELPSGINTYQLPAAAPLELAPGSRPMIPISSEQMAAAIIPDAPRGKNRLGIREFFSTHKKIRNVGALALGCAVLVGGLKPATGWTPIDAGRAGLSAIGLGESSDLTLKSLDCKTELATVDVDAMADVVWKVNLANPADIAKNKKNPKYKIPTTTGELPEYQLPATPFSSTKSTMVERYPKIGLKGEFSIIACDPDGEAFQPKGNSKVEVDLSKVDLKAIAPAAPQLDNYERFKVNINPKTVATSPFTQAEVNRLNAAIGQGDTKNSRLINAFKLESLDQMDESGKGEGCALEIRQMAKQAISTMLNQQASEQKIPHIDVAYKNDFTMPGESYRKDTNRSLYTNSGAAIKNPQITCDNVAIAGSK